MIASNDVGNVGLYGGAVTGTGTAAASFGDVITAHAATIGIGLTAFSVLVGLLFKVIGMIQDAKHNKVIEAQDAEHKRLVIELMMSKKNPSEYEG